MLSVNVGPAGGRRLAKARLWDSFDNDLALMADYKRHAIDCRI